jgi:hypothetical protein
MPRWSSGSVVDFSSGFSNLGGAHYLSFFLFFSSLKKKIQMFFCTIMTFYYLTVHVILIEAIIKYTYNKVKENGIGILAEENLNFNEHLQ